MNHSPGMTSPWPEKAAEPSSLLGRVACIALQMFVPIPCVFRSVSWRCFVVSSIRLSGLDFLGMDDLGNRNTLLPEVDVAIQLRKKTGEEDQENERSMDGWMDGRIDS